MHGSPCEAVVVITEITRSVLGVGGIAASGRVACEDTCIMEGGLVGVHDLGLDGFRCEQIIARRIVPFAPEAEESHGHIGQPWVVVIPCS